MRRSITFALLVLGLSLGVSAGCQRDASAWVGKWVGTLQRTSPDAPRDELQAAIDAISVNVKADRTFDLIESGMPFSGRWSLSGDQVVLIVTKTIGRPNATGSKERRLTLKKGQAETLVLDEEGASDLQGVVLERAVQREP